MGIKAKGWRSTFAIMWVGQSLSLLNNSLTMFAIAWYYADVTGSATILAAIAAISQIPQIVVSPFAGVVADRFKRKSILMISNFSVAVISLFIGVLFLSGRMQIGYIYFLVFACASASAFVTPVMQASVAMIAPEEKISKLVGLVQVITAFIGILGPGLGAILIRGLDIGHIMIINSVVALLSVTAMLFINIPNPERRLTQEKKLTFFQDFSFGIKYILQWRSFLIILVIGAVCNFCIMPVTNLVAIYITGHGGNEQMFALTQIMYAVGLIGGSVLLSLRSVKKKGRLLSCSIVGMGVGIMTILFDMVALNVRLIAGGLVMGLFLSFFNVSLSALVAAEVHKEVQGRIMAVVYSLVGLATPVSLFISGPVADAVGIRSVYIVAMCLLIVMGFAIMAIPSVRNIEKYRDNRNNEPAEV